jgi:hypothetical protein
VAGRTDAQNATYTNYGAGLGINVTQGVNGGNTGFYVAPTSTGLYFAVSRYIAGMQVLLNNNQGTNGALFPCYTLPVGQTGPVVIPWTAFREQCYATPPGPALAGPPSQLTAIEVQVGGTSAATLFQFCVTALAIE